MSYHVMSMTSASNAFRDTPRDISTAQEEDVVLDMTSKTFNTCIESSAYYNETLCREQDRRLRTFSCRYVRP